MLSAAHLLLCHPDDKRNQQACRGVAQPGSALVWGASGRPFKSAHPDQSVKGDHVHGRLSSFTAF